MNRSQRTGGALAITRRLESDTVDKANVAANPLDLKLGAIGLMTLEHVRENAPRAAEVLTVGITNPRKDKPCPLHLRSRTPSA